MRRVLYFALCGVFFILCAVAPCRVSADKTRKPAPIHLEGRTILFDTSATGERAGKAIIKTSDNGCRVIVTFSVPREADVTSVHYALFLKGARQKTAPGLLLNGSCVEEIPLRRTDGLLYQLPGGILKSTGSNLLEIKSSDGTRLDFESLVAFSLEDYEETHFFCAFGDVGIFVQPAKHPDQDKYDALHYDLAIELNMSTANIPSAVLSMTARVTVDGLTRAVFDFNINSGQMAISHVTDENGADLTYSTDTTNDWLLVNFPAPLNKDDTFTVRVYYSGTPDPQALESTFGSPYRRATHGSSQTPIIYTFSQPYGARNWWPCKDVPEDKATMDLHITAPKDYTVVSNGKLISTVDAGDDMQTWNYSESYPLATYLASICCTNYTYISGTYTSQDGTTTMTIGHYLYPEYYNTEKDALTGTLEAMNLFARLYGEYPFISEKYVTATHNISSGMEHQTCTSLGAGNTVPSGRGRQNIHELSHHWFGDSVTCGHYDHLWLNEGFATYSEALFQEYYNGETSYHNYVNAWVSSGISDTLPLVNSEADNFSSSLVYRKGAWVLHMIRHVLGDENYFTAIRQYYADYAYSTALTPDLQAEFEAVYGSSLDWFFNEWVYGIGRPQYFWSWGMEGKELKVNVSQVQSGDVFVMPIDIRVSDFNGNSKTFTVFNDQKSQTFLIDVGEIDVLTVEFDPENWILKYISTSTVQMPVLQVVCANPSGAGALVKWTPSSGDVGGYQLIMSDNMTTWTLAAGMDVLDETATSCTLTQIASGKSWYFRIRALSTTGQPSDLSDVYGFRRNMSPPRVLIVDGYDRWDSQNRGVSHAWAAVHGQAVDAYGISYDTCANEALINKDILPEDYDALIWLCGEESTADHTFDANEQALVGAYLDGGGKLFVTGAEIGWDLDYKQNGAGFYHNYLRANYVQDSSGGVYTVYGTPDGIFNGLSFGFDGGATDGGYSVSTPDVIAPRGGSIACLQYTDTLAAGVQYSITLPNWQKLGYLVYFGFPFETIYPESMRNEVMASVLAFFHLTPPSTPALCGAMLY